MLTVLDFLFFFVCLGFPKFEPNFPVYNETSVFSRPLMSGKLFFAGDGVATVQTGTP